MHFCGHGLEDGSLLLEDDGGNQKPVSPEALASLFELHKDYVDCVVLNACHSVKSAEAISEYINYAIGMNQKIQDKSAIQFAQGFYDGLGYETSENQDVFKRAFDEGLLAIKLESLSQAEIPVIKTRINILDKPNKPHKPMDISLLVKILVKILAPCLPFLMNVGNKAVEGGVRKIGEDVWQKAAAVWSKLQPKVEAKPATLEAAKDVANDPEDEDAIAALRLQLKKLFNSDATLATEIARIFESENQATSIISNVTASGEGAVALGDNASNNTITTGGTVNHK